MAERPILFSDPMVRAILAGRKSQTRRVVKPQPLPATSHPSCAAQPLRHGVDSSGREAWGIRWSTPRGDGGVYLDNDPFGMRLCPFGKPGDRLWVREAHAIQPCNCCVRWRADERLEHAGERWRPSIHMPRWASRLTLRVADVRVQRVQEIAEVDAAAEGVTCGADGYGWYVDGAGPRHNAPTHAFRALWDAINDGRGFGWESNPWVWAVSFEVVP